MYRSSFIRSLAKRAYSQGGSGAAKPPSAGAPAAAKPTSPGVNGNVPGLSGRVVAVKNEKVGPGASINADYKVPEYYCFNRFSFAEAEVEMAKFRGRQPSALESKK